MSQTRAAKVKAQEEYTPGDRDVNKRQEGQETLY
jgi:hypothetical protein